jgi:ubiquinone/menaquinone biosynthesis C-methylase UbiE
MKPHEMRDRKGLKDAQIARIEFVQGNFFNGLPFATDRFDYIRIAFLELAISENKWVPFLKEAWRVLKPGGHIEVIIETLLFPTVGIYDKLPVQSELEDEFKHMLEERTIPPTTKIGEKMFFDAFARVQTHHPVSVCIAPRPTGRSSLDVSPVPATLAA